jgi:hypothetical protein
MIAIDVTKATIRCHVVSTSPCRTCTRLPGSLECRVPREKARTVPIRGGVVADRDRPAGRVPDAFCRSFMAVLRSGPNFPGHVGPSVS